MSKSLSKIIGATFLVQIAIFFLVVLNNVLVSRWLGPRDFGMMATLLIFAESINKCINMGQETAMLYFISNRRYPERPFISTVMLNGLMIFTVGIGLIFVLIESGSLSLFFNAAELAVVREGAWWSIFLLFAAMMHEYGGNIWLGKQDFRRYNLNVLIRPVIYLLLLLIVFGANRLTVVSAVIIYGAAWFIAGAYIWVTSVFPIKLVWRKDIFRSTMTYGGQIMIANLLGFLIYRVDIFLIGYFLTQEDVGWYYVAVMVAERLFYLTRASGLVLMPAAAHSEEQQRKTPFICRLNFAVVLIGALLLAVSAPWIIPLVFTSSFENAVMPLIYLLPGIVAITIPKVLAADFLAKGLPRYTLAVTTVNFLLNLVLNIVLIPRMGISGAAISSSISYTVAAILLAVVYRRVTGTPIRKLLLLTPTDIKNIRRI